MEQESGTRLLVVDDDPGFVRTLQILLEDEGFAVDIAHSGPEALDRLGHGGPVRLVISDLAMPGMNGLEFLERLRQMLPHVAVIMMTAHSSVESAVRAIKLGAFQYLSKPVEPEELLIQVERALGVQRLQREHQQLRYRTGDPARFDKLVGTSPGVETLRLVIDRLARVDSTVLVRGETGTGKELVARLIHSSGPRAEQPFVVVNCTAIPGDLLESELFGHERGAFTGATATRTGRIEQADGGTLMLDEIGDMPIGLQPKLLRVLQEKRTQRVGSSQDRAVDVRVIAVTHRNLEKAIQDGDFREDLFHRLNTIPVTIPPLRERRQDLPGLCEHLLNKVAQRLGRPTPQLEGASLGWLAEQSFTGNVRELENLLERALVLGDSVNGTIGLPDLPVPNSAQSKQTWDLPLDNGFQRLGDLYKASEEQLVRRAVEAWPSVSNEEIARRLGTQRRVIERRMKDFGITK